MITEAFLSAYNRLNSKQKEAVDHIYGPVLVIAGPGSGKTQLLAARIGNILKNTDALPSNILCLTFTESAAKNMRDRLARMIGSDAYKVSIHTFHSFGNEILNRYRYAFQEYEDSNTIDDIIASRILDDILKPLPWNDPFKPGIRANETIKEILSEIANLKKGGMTPENFRTLLESNKKDLETLTPLLQETFEKIESLGQKKDEKLEKIRIFNNFTNIVQQLFENGDKKQIFGYDRLIKTISLSLTEAIGQDDGSGKTQFISTWKTAWTTLDHKKSRIWKESTKHQKQYSLAYIYEAYQASLESEGYIDFSDMILKTISFIEGNESVQANLAEQYQFILIDEYQDTNTSQMRLVHSIASVGIDSPNIFAVGDDDQSIYKFQGANIQNIRDFHDTYPDTKLIILDTNYRSHTEIIESNRSIIVSEISGIGTIFPGIEKQFSSANGTGGEVNKYIFPTEVAELEWIISDVERKIESGIPPEEIAIITKKNKSLEHIGKRLLEKQIPISMSKTESIWESELIRLVVAILKYLGSLTSNHEAGDILIEILAHPAWKINRLILWRISRDIYHARKDIGKSWIENLMQSESKEVRDVGYFLAELSLLSHTTRLEDLIDFITGANNLSLPSETDDENPVQLSLEIEILGGGKKPYVSPLYNYFFNHLSDDKGSKIIDHALHLANMKLLVTRIRTYKGMQPYLTLQDGIEFLEIINFYNITLQTTEMIGSESHAVTLATIHKAKGLEWGHVYIPLLTKREYKLGRISGTLLPKNLPLEADKDDDTDIERLIYTACTRAKSSLTLSYSHQNLTERANDPLPSLQTEKGDWEQIQNIPMESIVSGLETEKQTLTSLPYLGDESLFLKERIEKHFVMSVTALQNFLDVTKGGPEHFISNNILRFPQALNAAAAYGNAMHKAMEEFFTDYSKKGTFMESILIDSFERCLKKEGFNPEQEREWIERGKTNLDSLYHEISKQSYGQLWLEKDFRTDGGGTYLGDIQLTGKIDRIEKIDQNTIRITDYKTGKGFDLFDNSGTDSMKIKQWKYKLQLIFYSILFELSPYYRIYPTKEYELFFIEKDIQKDHFYRVREYIQNTEMERIKSLIHIVTNKIRALDFPDTSHYPKTIEGIRLFEEDLLNGNI